MKLKNTCFAVVAVSLFAIFNLAQAKDTNGNGTQWPNIKQSYRAEGDFITPASVGRVRIGVTTKDEVRLLLNNPHFHEGYFGVRRWNYIFNFYTGNGSEYVTCQYQVQFDKDWKVSAIYWRAPACANYIVDKKSVFNQTHPINISADGLFAFGRAGWNDLQEEGRENLTNLAGQIKNGYSNIRSIDIIGHTDHLGSALSNAHLSLERANTVKQFLVSKGIDARVIRTQGMGAKKPVVFCPGAKSAAIISCLMPNRRIEIEINGDK